MLFVSMINFIVLCLGAFYYCPRYFGSFINFCYACCHCGACMSAIFVAVSPYGRHCMMNIAPSHYEGNGEFSDSSTYQSDGGTMIALGIVQFMLWCCQCYCCCFPLLLTPKKAK